MEVVFLVIMPVKPIETKADFDQALIDAGDRLVVIDFFATWCGPCRVISPKVEEFSTTYDKVVFLKIDVDVNDETAESCGISAMPTFLFYKNGKKLDVSVVGADQRKLEEKIKALM